MGRFVVEHSEYQRLCNKYPSMIGVIDSEMEKAKKLFLNNEFIAEKNEGRHFIPQLKDSIQFTDTNKKLKSALNVFDKRVQVENFGQIQPIFYDRMGLWWMWESSEYRWKLTDEVDILNMVDSLNSKNIISSKERGEIINALKQYGRKNIPKDIKKTWIQFKDKIVDIESLSIFDATPEFFVTNPIPYEIRPSESLKTSNMDRIFEEWVGKDYVQTLYEIIAYSLIPDYPINRIFCLIGAGMNGKSKYLDLLRKFIGQYNCCATELDTLLNSRFEVTRLHKKLICQMGETNFNEMSKTSILKKLSGGDLIGFEYKNKNPFDEINYAKIIIATNNLPSTNDKTIGFYRRWLIIDFNNQFNEKKDILSEIPEEEYIALSYKCCLILKDLLKKREFTNEGTIEQRIDRYESKSDFVGKFMDLFTNNVPDGFITKAEFYRKFSQWCKENKHRNMSESSLGVSMKKKGIESDRDYIDWFENNTLGRKRVRVWRGISWKN